MNIQNGVICGLSDWLYLQGGSNSLMDYHTGAKQLSKEEIESWRQTLQYRHEWHQSRNIKYLQVFAPNKICVYPEFYPEELTIIGDRPIVQLIKNCGNLFNYQLDYLLNHKRFYKIYHETDTHWNEIGSFFAYQQIIQLMGEEYSQESLNIEDLKLFQKEMIGDLGNRFSPPKSHVAHMAKVKCPNFQKTFDNGVRNRGSIKKFINNGHQVGKLIIFGDSFTNSLLQFFADSFKEVIFVHAAFIDFDYIETEQPNIVINHMIERFIIQVPNDVNSPNVDEYAKTLGKI
jgi:alginate O-acetyltransferase complex protein AlgJ